MNNTTHKGGKCLTNEELAIEIQNGKTEYLPVLWEQIKAFVAMKADQRFKRLLDDSKLGFDLEFDDLYDSGYFAMLKAVKYFKPETGYTFLTFLNLPLKNAFNETISGRALVKKYDPLRMAISLDAPVGKGENLTLGETLVDDTDLAEEVINSLNTKDLHKALDDALAKLPPLEEKAIRLEFYSGLSIEQSSKIMKITPEEVNYLRHRGMSKLRSFEISSELLKYCPSASKRKNNTSHVYENKTRQSDHFNDLRLKCGL